jgi:hypothetical protein
MKHLKVVFRRFRNGFREGTLAKSRKGQRQAAAGATTTSNAPATTNK